MTITARMSAAGATTEFVSPDRTLAKTRLAFLSNESMCGSAGRRRGRSRTLRPGDRADPGLASVRCHSASNRDPQPRCRKLLNRNDNLADRRGHHWTPIEVSDYRQFYCHRNRLALSMGGVKVRRQFTPPTSPLTTKPSPSRKALTGRKSDVSKLILPSDRFARDRIQSVVYRRTACHRGVQFKVMRSKVRIWKRMGI